MLSLGTEVPGTSSCWI